MLTEEIARLTGTLKFNVDNRPLLAFEKRLAKVAGMLGDFSNVVNKKFQIKVALDSKQLRAQLDKAANAKIVFKNFSVSEESLAAISQKMADKLDRTQIRLKNVRIDIADLLAQKKYMKTTLGQIQVNLPVKMRFHETELRSWVKEMEAKVHFKLKVQIMEKQLFGAIKRAIYNAQSQIPGIKVKIADPQVKLNIDRNHIQQQLASVIQSRAYDVRVNVRRGSGSSASSREATTRAVGSGLAGGGLAAAGMGFARGALPGLGAAWALSNINSINQEIIASENALKAVSKTPEAFGSNKAFLEQITMEQGRKMRDVAPAFTSVLASAGGSIGDKGTQDLFRGVMKYSTVMGLDQESMKGTFRAIGQMFSKDKIQAEEAQGQLAERLPAAMQLLAEANGTSVAGLREQMQKGKLDPKKVLPEMARIMEDLADSNNSYANALKTSRVQQGRMNRQFELSIGAFSEGGFDQGIGSFFMGITDALAKAEPAIKALGGAFSYIVEPINAVFNILATLGNFMSQTLAPALGLTGGQLMAIAGIAGMMLLPFGTLAAAIAGVALVLEDLIVFSEGGDSVFGSWLESTPEAQKAFDGLKDSAKKFWENISLAFGSAGELGTALKNLSFSKVLISTMETIKALLDAFNDTVDRLVQAGIWAKKTHNGSTFNANMRNMQAVAMGPEWTKAKIAELDAQRQAEIVSGMTDPLTMRIQSYQGARQSLTADQIEANVQRAIQSVEINVPVDVRVSDAEMGAFFQGRIKKATEQALYDWMDRARARQKDLK